ncbi:MAG: flagellar basal body P-ring formation chaperone FlgA [Gammaproteobacteria bacterium]
MIAKTLILLVIIYSWPINGYAAPRYQPHAAIYKTVKDYVTGNIDTSSDYEINIAPLDTRLNLPDCTDHLEAFNPSNHSLEAGRLSIGVRCSNSSKWSIFTSVTLKIYADVVVLSQPVRRGQLLTRQHMSLETRDIAKLRNGYIERIAMAVNKQATRNMAAGTVLTPGLVAEPTLIKRGEKITISAGTSSFDIRMQGLALMDGIKGQLIRVKNVSSGRTIAGKVVKPGLVSVMN